MDISSMDVERKTFDTIRKGGFDRDQVSEYLERVARVLSKLESQLSVSRRHSTELQRQVTRAQREAEEGSKSFLFAAELKQRLIGEAEDRAAEILRSAHTSVGTDHPEPATREDLELVRRRSGLPEEDQGPKTTTASPDESVEGASPSAELDAVRAEAREILARANDEAQQIAAAAEERGAAFRAEAEQALEDASRLLEESTDKDTAIQEEVDRLVDEAKRESEAVRKDAEKRVAESNQTARKLVEEAGEEAGRIVAEAHQEGEVIEQKAAATVKEAEELRVEAENTQEASLEDREAARVARERAETESAEAEENNVEADRILTEAQEKAEAKLESAREEENRLLTDSAKEAATLRRSAREQAARLLASTESDRTKALQEAHASAEEILSKARTEAVELLETSRIRHRTAQTKLRDLDRMLDKAHKKMPAVGSSGETETGEEVVILLDEARETADEVHTEVWLTRQKAEETEEKPTRETQESRYARRSAGLPHLGDDASRVLGDLDSLRKAEPDGRSRRRRSK